MLVGWKGWKGVMKEGEEEDNRDAHSGAAFATSLTPRNEATRPPPAAAVFTACAYIFENNCWHCNL